jgi:ferrous iron transport protein B
MSRDTCCQIPSPGTADGEPAVSPPFSCSPTKGIGPCQGTVLSTEGFTQPFQVALAGNPNVGKSVVFNALTGARVDVSNFPGTTVGIAKGHLVGYPTVRLEDTPGVFGLSALSEEETVAEAALTAADIVINVVSAPTLNRDLFLTQQLIDWGYRLLVVVNQLDEAQASGVTLDLSALESRLGVPVVGCVATKNQGLDRLIQRLPEACTGTSTPDLPEASALRPMELDPGHRLKTYAARRYYINQWIRQVMPPASVGGQGTHASLGAKLRQGTGQALLHPLWGALALIVVLLTLYQVIGVWVAGDIVDFLENDLLLKTLIPWMQQGIALFAPVGSWLYILLAGEFGLATMTTQYLLGVMAPLVFGFYLYLSLLEDCGYLPRLAVLADAALTRVGLNGRAIIPMVLGLGCVTMATISTRVLTSQRERTIANALLAITIPCSAQLGVIMGMVALIGGLKAWLVYMGFLVAVFAGLGSVLNAILPGKSSGLVLDLPPLRWPQPTNVLKKTWQRGSGFLWEAAPLFLLGAAIVSIAQLSGLLEWVQTALAPVTQTVLHLPKQAASAFLMGMVRRDFGLAGFYQLQSHLTATQLMTSMIVITLFVPCIASATVLWKERGWREGAGVLTLSWLIAFGVGAVATRLLEWTGF